MNPHTFNGTPDPDEAENWVKVMERIFRVMQCSEQEKVLLATFQLDHDARAWWEATSRRLPNINIEWDEFLELFNTKYFSARIREKKANEFVELKQRMMSVAEYEAQFERLAQYAPHLVSTEKMKAKRFLEGLRPVFWEKLAPLDLVAYSDMVLRAQIVEDTMGLLERIYKKKVSQMMTLHISTGMVWSDERHGVIAMDCPQYPRVSLVSCLVIIFKCNDAIELCVLTLN
ncbi:hypothetical protein Taro_034802 [Colocasia esculenta]|uniref:Retrotransposon gag domain-containing protein n=1 Tax=Colocasia esculenta TaxID=4460 RepID=A0A843WB71_COLES|nr:hypothetical protein [Colocasia esculenta]